MILRIATLGAMCLLLLAAVARAAPVPGLFEVRVPVEDRSSAVRAAALRTGLAVVLVRVTGDGEITARSGAAELLRDPEPLVQQYRYESDTTSDGDARLYLTIHFDPEGVERAVRQAGLPLWGRDRPTVLLWLASVQGGQRQLVSGSDPGPFRNAVLVAAEERGLPVLLPLMDLEDRRRVRFSDIWGGFIGPVQAAAERYDAPVILVGRLEQRGAGRWAASWILVFDGGRFEWNSPAGPLEAVVRSGIGGTADYLAGRLAVQGGWDAAPLRLRVVGMRSLGDYARVQAYLASLTAVRGLELAEVSGDEAVFVVQVEGAPGALEQTLAMGRVLELVSLQPEWVYRVRP